MNDYDDLIFPKIAETTERKRGCIHRLVRWWHLLRGRKVVCHTWDMGKDSISVETVVEYDKATGSYTIIDVKTHKPPSNAGDDLTSPNGRG